MGLIHEGTQGFCLGQLNCQVYTYKPNSSFTKAYEITCDETILFLSDKITQMLTDNLIRDGSRCIMRYFFPFLCPPTLALSPRKERPIAGYL